MQKRPCKSQEEFGLRPKGSRESRRVLTVEDLAAVCRRPEGWAKQMAGRTVRRFLQKCRQKNIAA